MISSVILDKKAESDPPKNQKISSERNLDSEIIVNEDDETVFLFDKIIETIDLDKI